MSMNKSRFEQLKSCIAKSATKIFSAAFISLLLFISVPTKRANATHAAGSDLTYTWISGNTFRVTVSFYRDCAGVAAPNSITLNARSASCNRNQNYTLTRVAGTGQEITFPCNTAATKCTNGSSAFPGYQQYLYQANITLPQQCADWVLSYFVCCRNCAITTLNNPCNANMYVEATLNNVAAPSNSSPQFTNVPVAFICLNQSFTYNHGVYDPNGDSLVYTLINPKTYNTSNGTVGNVTFNPGYSATNPVSSSPAMTLNSVTGDVVMFPTNNNEIGVAAILIREYRNGVLIGSVTRDMQFITKFCNPNFLPSASGINGTSNFSAVACPGVPLTFTINSADPNPADTITMTWNNVIPGATFTQAGVQFPVGTFSWTPSAADARSQPYTFIVTVRDNACPTNGTQTYSYSIKVPTITNTVSSPAFNGYNVACFGTSSGSATASGGGGTPPYTYLWNPSGQTTPTATGLSAITYTVTATDSSGCSKDTMITLTEPPSVVASSIDSSFDVSCNGGSDGSAFAGGSGGLSPYTYSWSPGAETTSSISGKSAGSYTVTITDLNGCTSQSIVNISEPVAVSGSISSFTNVTCNGNANGSITASASGGTPPYTHSWSNGMTTGSIFNLGPGTYTDTIRDSKGCQALISQTITEPPAGVGIPSSSVTVNNVSCFGGDDGSANLSPSGGTMPYSIFWSNGDTGNSADTLISGTYSVTIIDANGCTFDTLINVTEPALLDFQFVDFTISPGGTHIFCSGDSTGQVRASVFGGTPGYTYAWSEGSTTDSISGVPAGAYWVTITDANGCTVSDTVTFTEPPVLSTFMTKQDVACKGESSGYAKANVSGGSPMYSYSWSPFFQTTDSIGGIPAGFYQVTIDDINGCQVIDTVTISEPDTIVPLITAIQFFGDVNVRCNGDSSATVSVQVTGGTAPYSYEWSSGATSDTAFNLPAGIVAVKVSDINGCSIRGNHSLSEPDPFFYSSVINHPGCYGEGTGSIVLNASGSTPPYSYAWSSGSTADSSSGLTAGTEYVWIEDANMCRDSVGFILSEPDSMSIMSFLSDYQGFNVSCFGGNDGGASIFVFGGTMPYSYAWSNGATTDVVSGLSAIAYTVTITDNNGCTKDTIIALSEPTPINLSVTSSMYAGGVNVSCFNYNDGYAHAFASGGVGPYRYLWSNGDQADSALGLTAGSFNLLVTDSNSCTATAVFSMTEPVPLTLTATFSDFNGYSVPCAGDSSACIALSVNGGSTPYSYMWDIQDTLDAPMICGLPADTVGLRVTDTNGCIIDTTLIPTEPPALALSSVLSDYSGFNVQCPGYSNGSIDLTVSGGAGSLSYIWSNGDTLQDLINLSAGTYSVTITDVNNCTSNFTFVLDEPPMLLHSTGSRQSTCAQSNGVAWVSVNSGLTPYSYLWNPSGQTSDTISGLVPGMHYVTITDSVGCNSADSVLVSDIPVMAANIVSQTNIFCNGDSTGSITASVTGGSSPYMLMWSNGDTTLLASALPAGTYTLTITDSAGCIETVSATITQPSAINSNVIVTDARCDGVNDGTAMVSANGGTSPYTYSWSNGDNAALADSLAGGTYTVTITDANSCTHTNSATVQQPNAMTLSLLSVTEVSCFGRSDGSATVNPAIGGTPPYIYSWSNSDSGILADSLAAGTVVLTVRDANNCVSVLNVTITEPALLQSSLSSTSLTCFGSADGSVSATVTGGTAAYTYNWTPGNYSGNTVSNLPAGTYSLIVTDSRNCTSANAVTITQPVQLTADAGASLSDCEPVFQLNAQLDPGLSGRWTVITGAGQFSDANSPVTSVTQMIEGDNYYRWTVTDGTCFNSDSVLVYLVPAGQCDLELPSGFSPNGDGFNDGFFIKGIDRYPNNFLMVFNRWGNEVYRVENYRNSQWKGQNNSGDDLPEGTYFIMLEIMEANIRMNTYVDLRR
ncbi:MAG: hypothetical protein DWQ44_06860 [Bacteroidetes bacterium]|nr:MAG: hypothetical protein DWQ39_01850 [Bacteroidota bacterium]REK34350.1 MAG: hypothetical protein DWQ44_06860 [Bacteroidota bacterium]REK49195.1 MAG: hypothetical protein DWQ48_08020 [Bacteroidota bacterium]